MTEFSKELFTEAQRQIRDMKTELARLRKIEAAAKELVESLNADEYHDLNELILNKALTLTNLEIVYMWIGKAIRDDQIDRNGIARRQK